MFQVRFHGRGGQGVVTAAELLAEAAFREGRHAQAFPSFGSERMGAPVMSFCRIDDQPIRTHEPVTEPGALLIQDPTLLHQADLFAGLGAEGYMLNHTGAWRTERPVYVHNLPPCNSVCPAGENVQQWLYDAEEGGPEKYEAGWRQIMEDNPFPAIMGRVCYRPCETACNRAQLDSAVGVNSVERFLGDEALRRGWKVPVDAAPTGRRVLVVGAGPSGLSAAYHLTRLGHLVTVKDAGGSPGGMMRYGIPKYRLPRDILDAEVNRILDMGVTLELNTKVTDILGELNEAAGGHDGAGGGFDAAFVAVGAHIGRRAYIPAGDSARILDAVSLLHGMEDRSPPCWAAGSPSTAAATRPWTRRVPRGGSARPKRSWSTAGPATGCPRTTSRSPRPWTRASRCAGCPRSSTPTRASC
jgi:Pyruvate ferredoxin/flavodoxin oxidoreductase/Dihydroprymidine dehydrogenase domain II, 4Fe-4S cluster/NAD(P)-binding Rossmann-like domain